MVATKLLTMDDASAIADEYVTKFFDSSFFITNGKKVGEGWHFTVKCRREDLERTPAVGSINLSSLGEVQALSEDRIRDMRESAETQAAQHRQELARDEEGYVLRYHARIKASIWLSKNVDFKIGATGGFLVPIDAPIWRFSVYDFARQSDDKQLGVIDIDATTGEVLRPDEEELEIILRGACAFRRYPEYTTTA